jgi:hypothetical protein
MAHLAESRAAVAGKRRGNNTNNTTRMADSLMITRRLIFALAALFAASVSGSASLTESAPFAGLAGYWSGAGTVTLDDGSTEKIRCRATYAVSGNGSGLNQTLTCASDSYKFDLKTNVTAEQQGSISGNWSESSRNINGNLSGHASNGNFQVIATAAGFTANITLTTHGNKQSVVIRPDSQFKGASITLTRS